MIVRYWLFMILLGICTDASLTVLTSKKWYYFDELIYYLYYVAPWTLCVLALLAWYRSFIWRRMKIIREAPPTLSRGDHLILRKKINPSVLEYICALLFLLGLAAIFRQQHMEPVSWWIGTIIVFWLSLKKITKWGMRV